MTLQLSHRRLFHFQQSTYFSLLEIFAYFGISIFFSDQPCLDYQRWHAKLFRVSFLLFPSNSVHEHYFYSLSCASTPSSSVHMRMPPSFPTCCGAFYALVHDSSCRMHHFNDCRLGLIFRPLLLTSNHRSALIFSSSVMLSPDMLFSAPFVHLRDSRSIFLFPLTFTPVACVFHHALPLRQCITVGHESRSFPSFSNPLWVR